MPAITEVLSAALAHHQAGRYPQAESIYRQVLQADPNQPDAWHLLGLVLFQTGRGSEAIGYLEQALRRMPNFAEAHFNLGNVHRELGHLPEAIASYERAVRLRPDYAEAHFNLGNACQDARQFDAAIRCFHEAIRCKPAYTKAWNNLGNALMELGRFAEAADCYQQILRANPNYAKGHNNLGHALRNLGRPEESIVHCRMALQLEPGNAEALNNLAAAQLDLGLVDEAISHFSESVRVRPGYAEAHMNRAMAWLSLGDFARGWPEYEWRWQSKAFVPRGFKQPLWNGSSLTNRTILIHSEQGLGDTLQFVRYLPLVAKLGGKVLFECPASLHPLLREIARDCTLLSPGRDLPGFDLHAPLMSLPHLLSCCPDSGCSVLPWGDVPYLAADPALMAKWRSELTRLPGHKIGINWQGNPANPKDWQRSFAFGHFLTLVDFPGVQLISLQKGHGSEQLAQAPAGAIVDWGSRLDETGGAFVDTAAVLTQLDLVITSDTALAHLAGALNIPVWVLLSTSPDWRWQLSGEASPWYPSMTLLRQSKAGDWCELFARVALRLKSLLPSP